MPTLALIAKSADELQSVLLDPLFAGWSDGTIRITVSPTEQPIVKAILTHIPSPTLFKSTHAVHSSACDTCPEAATTGVATLMTSTTVTTEPKVPKSLPPAAWNALVKIYQSIQLDGRDRIFPVTELIGAESVLARMFHELTVSGQFTPILLGEILQRRSFNASRRSESSLENPQESSDPYVQRRP